MHQGYRKQVGLGRRVFRWGAIFLGVHSIVLLLIAPSAFLYYGEGFLFSRNQAQMIQRIIDGPVENLVYDFANNRIPPGVYGWLARRISSLDEVTLLGQTVLYLIFGGALYFGLGLCFGGLVSLSKLHRHRVAG
ncbi:MAG: hypothetical protein QOF14_4552 [Hyphomicrobiales bacterium]|jgi:hypothetical protein|nr:hypothetical protein [Hyphomicrobiales bacterium]